MGRISQQQREDFTDFVELLIKKDENKIVDALLKLTNFTEDPDRSELQRDLMEFIDRYAYLPLKKLEIAQNASECFGDSDQTRHEFKAGSVSND